MDINNISKPEVIQGNNFVDDRGSVFFLNDLSLVGVKRFYVIENHSVAFVRAWHGHMLEAKVFIAIQGTFLVGIAPMTSPLNPSRDVSVGRYILDSSTPQALLVPAGFANGSMSLSVGAKLMVLSSTTLEESHNDDYRFAHDYWNIWNVENR